MLFVTLSFLAIVLAALGMAGRGTWSVRLAYIGSSVWLIAFSITFLVAGWRTGSVTLVGTLLIGSLAQKVFRRLIGTDQRASLFDLYEEKGKAESELAKLNRDIGRKRGTE